MEQNRIAQDSAEYWAAIERLEELLTKAEVQLMGLDWEDIK